MIPGPGRYAPVGLAALAGRLAGPDFALSATKKRSLLKANRLPGSFSQVPCKWTEGYVACFLIFGKCWFLPFLVWDLIDVPSFVRLPFDLG